MCTVTYFPLAGNRFRVVVNRDESPARKMALPPVGFTHQNAELLAPRDGEAGGTWAGCARNGRIAVLLNGAFGKHQRHLPYRHSRGLITLDMLAAPSLPGSLSAYPLHKIEPFTLLCFHSEPYRQIIELKWDGEHRFFRFFSPERPLLICSAPLYNHEQAAQRRAVYTQWFRQHDMADHDRHVQIHKMPDNRQPYGFCMDREVVRTISVTAFTTTPQHIDVEYHDLLSNALYLDRLVF